MVYWLGHAGAGAVTIKVWFEDEGVLALKRALATGGDFTPVAHNSGASPVLSFSQPDPGPQMVYFEVDAVAASIDGHAQTLWHSAEQNGAVLSAVDDALNPIDVSSGQIALAPDCPDNQHEQRWFEVMFG